MSKRTKIAAGSLVAAACLLALLLIFWRETSAGRGAVEWDELVGSRSWLDDVSTWSQSVDLDHERPARGDLGCFTIGDGRIFTVLGLTLPLNTLENMIGPTYQKRTGFLGQETIGLRIDGRDVPCAEQSVHRVRRAGIVRTALRGDGYVLETLDFAPPGLGAIARIIGVRNLSERSFRADAVVHLQRLPLESAGPPALLRRGPIRVLAGVLGDGARTRSGQQRVATDGAPEGDVAGATGAIITVPFGKIKPNEGRAKIHYLATSRDKATEQKTLQKLEADGVELLDRTREWWQTWHDEATTVHCPDARVSDLIDDVKEVLKTQQAADGGFAPMHMYTYCWARDSNGPIRYLLRCGKFDDVKQALDYYYEASARRGGIWLNHPLDTPLAGETPRVNWRTMPMESAEVPSFLVLQHYWYYRHSGDIGPIRAHWQYLRRNIEGQEVSPDGRLPFHGDETYRFPGYAIWLASHTEPDNYLELDNLFSADSAFEYVAAAEGMQEMAAALGRDDEARHFKALAQRVRNATERFYWQSQGGFYAPASSRFSSCLYRYPFANVNLRPLWVGYSPPDDASARQNLLTTLSYLWRDDGTVDTTPGFGYTTGMTPGMVLYNLAAIDHSAAETALRGVMDSFSPAGGIAEMLEPENRPSEDVWGKTRARPWEGGINAEAVLYYLSGFEPDAPHMRAKLCPRLPFGWKSLAVNDMRIGDNRLSVSVTREPAQTQYRLTNDGSSRVSVELVVSLPQCAIDGISVAGKPWQGDRAPVTRYGRTRQPIPLSLAAGGEAEVIVKHGQPAATAPKTIRRKAFTYPAPDIGAANVVVVTLRAETAEKWREQDANAFVIDSYIAFPASYLRRALLTPDGNSRRVETLVLDIRDWPGSFKLERFWTWGGPGRRIVRRFEELGGSVVRERPPRGWQPKRLPLQPGQSFEEEEEEDS